MNLSSLPKGRVESPWNLHRLVSLWEIMEQYKVGDLMNLVTALTCCVRDLSTADQLSKLLCTDKFMSNLASLLNGIGIISNNFDADPSLLAQITELEKSIRKNTADRRAAVLHARLQPILFGVQNNLEHRIFMYMPAEDAQYWDNPTLFGEGFLATFPKEALLEMREAGNCLAVRRGTACIFHCMRVAEYGLRKLAKRLKVKLTDKGRHIPIEAGTWQKVIEAIRTKINESRRLPAGTKKDKLLEFYSSAVDHCEYMKDIWRNNISHTKKLYTRRDEVLLAFGRVHQFVQLISRNISGKLKRIDG